MSAPIARKMSIIKFIVFIFILHILDDVIRVASQDFRDFFLCRKCGCEIVKMSNMVNIPSTLAIAQRNDTFGPKKQVLIQLFKNPQGIYYDVITSTNANVYRASRETGGDTWWPGFNWIILGCPQCKQHIGWEYVTADKSNKDQTSFFGLVLTNLLHENDADNLIVLPKSYRS